LIFLEYENTWWGLLSGLSWVPAGVAAVIAVQNIGIAVGQAVWQVTVIMTSFVWSFVFLHDEKVFNWWGTAIGILCLTIGVVGMALSFNLEPKEEDVTSVVQSLFDEGQPSSLLTGLNAGQSAPASPATPSEGGSARRGNANTTNSSIVSLPSRLGSTYRLSGVSTPRARTRRSLSDVRFSVADVVEPEPNGDVQDTPSTPSVRASPALGLAAALFNGVWGGSNLVPSKYAPIHGVHFVIAFATGALAANALLLFIYLLLARFWWHCPLPLPHFKVMALPGCLSGILWSAGNFCSLYAVQELGQATGNSMIQSSVVVSGLWGICLFGELKGTPILWWFLGCAISVGGVVILGLERRGP